MALRSLLRKEAHWSRRNLLVLAFLLLLLPTFFAATSVLFQDVVPRETPVALVPADGNVTDEDMEVVEAGLTAVSNPVVTEDSEEARRMLDRESVYAIVEVPGNVTDPTAEVEFSLIVDGSLAPFLSPSKTVQGLVEVELDRLLDADVTSEREVVGEEKDLPEYLYPTFLVALMIFFAFTYVPFNLRSESSVLDRLRVETSLEAVVAAKILFFTALMLVPVLVFHVAGVYHGYAVASLHPGAILALLLTFLLLVTVSSTVMVLTRFGGVGLFANAATMLGVLALSGLAFPLGFFSPLRTTIARALPTYYASVTVRSLMLKDVGIGLYADWLAGIGLLTLLAIVALKASIVYYRRTS